MLELIIVVIIMALEMDVKFFVLIRIKIRSDQKVISQTYRYGAMLQKCHENTFFCS